MTPAEVSKIKQVAAVRRAAKGVARARVFAREEYNRRCAIIRKSGLKPKDLKRCLLHLQAKYFARLQALAGSPYSTG